MNPKVQQQNKPEDVVTIFPLSWDLILEAENWW